MTKPREMYVVVRRNVLYRAVKKQHLVNNCDLRYNKTMPVAIYTPGGRGEEFEVLKYH